MAAPRQMRIWVRNPAALRLRDRSIPMAPPHSNASSSRAATERKFRSRSGSRNVSMASDLL